MKKIKIVIALFLKVAHPIIFQKAVRLVLKRKTPNRIKKRIIDYVGREPLKSFIGITKEDFENTVPLLGVDVDDLPVEFWIGLKGIMLAINNENPTYNKLTHDVITEVIAEYDTPTHGKVNN